MARIVHAQGVFTESEIEALKQKTGETTTKDALAKAVQHYLECEYVAAGKMWARKLETLARGKQTKAHEALDVPQ